VLCVTHKAEKNLHGEGILCIIEKNMGENKLLADYKYHACDFQIKN